MSCTPVLCPFIDKCFTKAEGGRTKTWTLIGALKGVVYVFKRTKRYSFTPISSNRIYNRNHQYFSKLSITRHFFSLHKNWDNRVKCEKLNTLFTLYKLFPLCTLYQRWIQDEHKTCYKQGINSVMGWHY